MSYPPPIYDGTDGEVTAWVRPAGSPPEIVYPNGNRVRYLARGDDGVPGVLARRLGGIGEEPALRVGHLVGAPRFRAREGAVDVELVGLEDGDPVVHECVAPWR